MATIKISELRDFINGVIKSNPNISEIYIVGEVMDFIVPLADKTVQKSKDDAELISKCLNFIGIKNEIVEESNLYIVKRLGV